MNPAGSAALPPAALVVALPYLPPDTRLLLAATCRAWREALAPPGLWLSIDLSPHARAPPHCAPTDALLAALAARAAGGLLALDVRGCERVSIAAIAAAVRASPYLATVDARSGASARVWPFDTLHALLSDAAPALTAFHADVEVAQPADAVTVLTAAPPLAPLRCRLLRVSGDSDDEDAAADAPPRWTEAALCALGAAITASCSGAGAARLCALNVTRVPLSAAALDALVDAALARRLTQLHLTFCELDLNACAPLARLLDGGSVQDLLICGLRAAGVPNARAATLVLGSALSRNRSLRALHLAHVDGDDATTLLLLRCVGHPTLAELTVFKWWSDSRAVRSRTTDALAMILMADAEALHTVRFALPETEDPTETEEYLRHVISVLHHQNARRLRALALTPPPRNNDVGRMLLNAVRHGATELRRLELVAWAGQEAQAIDAHALEAVRLVEARAAADAQH